MKRLVLKGLIYGGLGIAAIGVFSVISGLKIRDLGIDLSGLKVESQPYHLPSEILESASEFDGQKLKVKGTVSYRLRTPDHIGSTLSLDGLPLKVPSDQIDIWRSKYTQEVLVEGTLTSIKVLDPTFDTNSILYYLANPEIVRE